MANKSHALITGASSGLGKQLAMKCAFRGYPLILVALPGTGLECVATELKAVAGVEVYTVETDLTDEFGPQNVFDFCAARQLQVGVLINNAGIGLESSFTSAPLSFCTSLIQLNTLAVVKMTGLFLPDLISLPVSYILNVSSLASYTPMPFKGIYSASKSFINSFSCSLRTELRGTGVSISVLCPGGIPTNETVRKRIADLGWVARAGMMEPDKLADIALKKLFSGKQVIIPGRINRFSKLLMRIVPSQLQQEILYHTYNKKMALKFVQPKRYPYSYKSQSRGLKAIAMKLSTMALMFLLTMSHTAAQNLNLPSSSPPKNEVDISSSQIAGCTFLGLGIATIGYTAAKTQPTNNPALWYTGGSILATAGILILIFGDKEPQVKYWKGMEGYLPPPGDTKNHFKVSNPVDFSPPLFHSFNAEFSRH